MIRDCYNNLAPLDSAQGNFKQAYEHHKLYITLRDSLVNGESTKKITQLQMQNDFDKKEEADSIKKEAEHKIITAELKQEQTKSYALYGGLALMLVFGGFMFNRFKVTQRQKNIISEQKGEVDRKNLLVETKNKEITQSIEYALKIQTAILPPLRLVKQHLENSFILYKPKDIVAGDFYWMETVQLDNVPNSQLDNETNQLILFAACDCTGHGVPGAMVSVVCHNALNRAVREFGLTEPAAILDKTAEIVIEYFSKSEESIKDGMDISLCCLSPTLSEGKGASNYKLEWAGANNPLWLLQNGEIIETKANKQPIGMNENSKPFTNHTFILNEGDTIYLFTDGYADQFGGAPVQKKLTKKRFKDLVLSIQDKSMQEQGIGLDKFIIEYRKEVEQIDDILVMGVRV